MPYFKEAEFIFCNIHGARIDKFQYCHIMRASPFVLGTTESDDVFPIKSFPTFKVSPLYAT